MFDSITSRRELLTRLSGTGAVLAGIEEGSASASGRTNSAGSSGWEAVADKRIRKHRKAPLQVRVLDQKGNPVPNATVDVRMRRHGFDFGTAVDAKYLMESSTDGDDYRRHLTNLFNKAVLGNRHKWKFWEQDADRKLAKEATRWLLRHGLEMRGHTCIWQRPDQGAIPPDVVDAVKAGDSEHLNERIRNHISEIVGFYSDVPNVTEWDVVSEQLTFHAFTNVLDPFARSLQAPSVVEWLRIANEADPDAQLFVNEYDIVNGGDHCRRQSLEQYLQFLQENDANLGGVGLQAHHPSAQSRQSPTELLDTLDRIASYGVPLKITEYDTWGDDWTEQMEADYLYRFLKTVFSHPGVEGFLMWGFWDELHWMNNAPLFREDWTAKPTLQAYQRLVYDEWWTVESGRTNADGVYSTDGFLGLYEVSASSGRRSDQTQAKLPVPTSEKTVVLRLGD